MILITGYATKTVFQSFKKVFGIGTLAILIFSSFLNNNQSVEAQELICPERAIEQITEETDGASFDPSISADGRRIAFFSNADINGGNPEGNLEIYLFDTITMALTQITEEMAGGDSFGSSISADGRRIAFFSNANINGGNPEGNFEIYLFDTITMTLTQITEETAGVISVNPSINADGSLIAFNSNLKINGGNPEGNTEIYLFDTNTMALTQITEETMGASLIPSINADGTRISFESFANITGGNPDKNREAYLVDRTTGIFTQITNTTAASNGDTSINADGTRIAFSSDANINGGNPEGNFEIYLFDTSTGAFTQVTDETEGISNFPSINADGRRIAFTSSADINGGNPDGQREIYLFDTGTMTTIQITNETVVGGSSGASINADGRLIAFTSLADINGGNPEENNEIFLATCFDPADRAIPTLSEWGLIAMAGILGIVGFMVLRRRNAAATS